VEVKESRQVNKLVVIQTHTLRREKTKKTKYKISPLLLKGRALEW